MFTPRSRSSPAESAHARWCWASTRRALPRPGLDASYAPPTVRDETGSKALQLGAKIKAKFADKVVEGLSSHLYPGEAVQLIVKTNKLSPMLDAIVVTDGRLLALQSTDVASKGPRVNLRADKISQVTVQEKRFTSATVEVATVEGDVVALGTMIGDNADGALVQAAIDDLHATGVPMHVVAGEVAAAASAAEVAAEAEAAAPTAWYSDVIVVGRRPSDKAHRAILEHAAPDEKAWLVLGSGSAGVLAAFEDRLLIVKVGGMTGYMTGALGGGRITTFPYAEITGLEYNSGLVNGVLEVLTPSYQGTANKDFWRGSSAGRNADSNDPYTLSNTLPFPKELYRQAAPHLAVLRAKLADSKRPVTSISGVVGVDLADEIGKLAQLHAQGVLDDAEFADAKRAAISRQTR